MDFIEVSPSEWATEPMRLIARGRLLLLSRAGERQNGMAVAWGTLGVMWGVPVIGYAVRPSRHSHRLTEEGSEVSLCALPEALAGVFSYFGTHSGGGEDKFAATGLHPTLMPCGGMGLEEAELIVTAQKIYAHATSAEELRDGGLLERWYSREPFHTLYFARIERIYLPSRKEK